MSMNGPLRTGYDNGIVPTPDVGESTRRGEGVSLPEGGGQGLTGTPFEKPLMATPSGSPTGNASGIPNDWLTDGGIPNAPSPGSTASVADGVATPNTPAGNMTGGKDGANIGIGKS
jgi:hypothetical protein